MVKSFFQKFMFARFLVVGVMNTIVGLTSIYIFFNVVSLNYWASTAIGNVIGGICSYILNKKYTFQVKSSTPSFSTAIKFIGVNIVAYFTAYYIGYWIITMAESFEQYMSPLLYENLSILIASGLFTIFNYVGHKYITFANRSTPL
ncbi:GtrA family protein [Paenibacillus sp. SC116]|uniref:GtrA family protein n=1 Tax=Paenibacillus sp. SC116 TaxID=2968986 RepID=UPI00215A49BD|nr:GtrA family protein [Paenibacillus sp. SC116]MCR8842194.1 GtrA family protein [Paenibacillus sp. SC116]